MAEPPVRLESVAVAAAGDGARAAVAVIAPALHTAVAAPPAAAPAPSAPVPSARALSAAPRGLGGRRFLLSIAIICASISLALGISLPSIKLTKFFWHSTDYSLIDTVVALIRRNQIFLGALVFVFSILLPIFKILYLVLLTTMTPEALERQYRRLRALEWLGKWSMHDVLVLALMIFFIKSQGIYDAKSLIGVYFFTAAVVFMILAYAWLNIFSLNAIKAKRQAPVGPPRVNSTLRNFMLALFILTASICFALGVILPSIRFTTAYVWVGEYSVATIIWQLYTSREYFLCAVIAVFSVIFPFLKLLYLLTLCLTPNVTSEFRQGTVSIMEWLGRYSMTDVMVLALIIFYMNSQGYTSAQVLPGVYCFAASALMTMFAYGWANAGHGHGHAATAGSAAKPAEQAAPIAEAAPVAVPAGPLSEAPAAPAPAPPTPIKALPPRPRAV